MPINGSVHHGSPKLIESHAVKKAAVPTTAYVAREKMLAVPITKVQQTLIAAKIPKVAPAVRIV
jgi:hypothetical protein